MAWFPSSDGPHQLNVPPRDRAAPPAGLSAAGSSRERNGALLPAYQSSAIPPDRLNAAGVQYEDGMLRNQIW